MDRLHTLKPKRFFFPACGVCCFVVLGMGCGEKKQAPAVAPSRGFDVVMAAPKTADKALAEFCDTRPQPDASPVFAYPGLATPIASAGSSAGWRWINVWATWCKPCIEELPLLAGWRAKLASKNIRLEYMSVDQNEIDVQKFVAAHPDLRSTSRISTLEQLGPWLQSIGLDEHATIPVHVFVNPRNEIRCVRAGGLSDKHWSAIEHVVSGG